MNPATEWNPHQLYRLYDAGDALLYVGVTADLCRRLRQHRRHAPWWAAVASGTSEQHPDWFLARSAERATIAEEGPVHNRDRALRADDRSARSALAVPMLSSLRALPEVAIDLRGYLPVPDSAEETQTSDTSKTRTRVRGTTFPNSPKNGHCGHCPYCQRTGGAR